MTFHAASTVSSSQRVRQLLQELDWNQAKLANKLGVAPNTVSRWMTGALPVPSWLHEYLGAMLALRRLAVQFDVL